MKNKLKLLLYAAPAIPTPNIWIKDPSLNGVGPSNTLLNFGLIYFQGNIIPFVVSLLLFILVLVSFVFLAWGGITWITSGGEKEGMTKAKATVTGALIGLALGLSAFIVLNILFSFFGITGASVNCGPGQEC